MSCHDDITFIKLITVKKSENKAQKLLYLRKFFKRRGPKLVDKMYCG